MASTPMGTTWTAWNHSYNITITSATTTINNAIWQHWNTISAGTTTSGVVPVAGTAQFSGVWTTTGTTSYIDNAFWAGWNGAYTIRQEIIERTEAEREEMAQREAERVREAKRRDLERAAAAALAEELLMEHLDAQQKRDVLEHGWFEVISNKGRRWRIRRSSISGNVDLMPEEGDARLASYCAHASEAMPAGDHHLIQKLILEADEEQFTSVANVHYRAPDATNIPDRRRLPTEADGVMVA